MKRLLRYYFCLLSILFLVSCEHKKSVPFPENPSGFKVPVAVPFKLPEAKPFQWREIPGDSIPKGFTSSFDIGKLPSVPFSINDFKSLKSPMSSIPLIFDKLPELKINLDTIKAKPVRVTKFRLPEPLITRLNPPTKWEGTTSGLLRLAQSEGLIGNQIYALVADSLGSIWISTERGLCKYNGDVFQSYNFLKRDLTGNLEIIADFDLDKSGNIWMVADISGIYKLNTSSGIVEHYKTGAGFIRIQEDYDGLIWVTNPDKGFFFMDPRNCSIKQLALPISKTEATDTYGIFEDANNNLWIGYRNKLAILNAERNSIRLIGKAEGLTIGIPYNFTEDSKGNVWIAAFSKEAKSISLAEDKIFTLGANDGFYGVCRDVVSDSFQRIWIMDNDTVSIYDPVSHRLKKIPTGAAFRVDGLPSKAISDLKGNIWIGTAKSGIIIMESQGMLSEHFNTNNGLVSNEVWGILEDKYQRIWLATYRGINIYDPVKEKLYLLKLPDKISTNNFRKISLLDDNHLLAGSVRGFCIIDIKINTLTTYQSNNSLAGNFWQGFYDHEENLWLSSSKGVYKFNPDKNRMWNIDESSGLISNTVWFLVPDQKGKIWIGTGSGLNVIDPKENTIVSLGKEDGLTSNYSSMVFKNKMEEMIIGGDKGFSIINQQRNLITNVSSKEGLIPEGLYDMTELNGRIHIGSENGLIIVDRPSASETGKAWRFTNYNKSEGFTSNDYNQGAAFPTSGGKVWWAASPVLSVILQDPIIDSVVPKAYITGINIMDQHPDFLDLKQINSQLSVGDTIWNSERTRYSIKDKFPIDSSYLAQNNISWDSLSPAFHMPIGLKMPYNQNSFNFTFTNLDIKGRDKIVYRYILDGAELEWSETSSRFESKNYYNIQPGKYTFKVSSRGFNSVWSKPAELSFTIAPPWWETWWAYSIYSILFIAGVLIADRFQKQRLIRIERGKAQIRELAQAKEIEKAYTELKSTQSQLIQSEKMASLGELTAGIAHEIQNPLNFVNNFSEVSNELIDEMNEELDKGDIEEAKAIAADIKQNLEKINHHGKRADAIVKGMLQHSRSSTGTKEPANINALADEYLRLAYHGLRAKDKSFNASMKTDFDESIGNINIIPQDIGRVILNLITNAFYAVTEKKQQLSVGYEPTVSVNTKRSNGKVEIIVADNGNGIPQKVIDKIFQPFFTTKPSGQGTGLGLSMSYEIVTKGHGGELKVETKEGEGSVFTIVLPVV
jgi:signal transduction histidine kinase/ligand-binding sensor domain-containing protein